MEDADFDKVLLERDRRARESAALLSRDDNGAEIRTRFGTLRANGPVAVIVLVVLLCTFGVAWAVRDHDLRTTQRADATDTKVENVSQKMDEVVYVLTLSESDRKALKLDMPDSMRRKQR